MIFKEYLKNLPELNIKTLQCQKTVGSTFNNAVATLQPVPKPRLCLCSMCCFNSKKKGRKEHDHLKDPNPF